jgi:hypothetical protein
MVFSDEKKSCKCFFLKNILRIEKTIIFESTNKHVVQRNYIIQPRTQTIP